MAYYYKHGLPFLRLAETPFFVGPACICDGRGHGHAWHRWFTGRSKPQCSKTVMGCLSTQKAMPISPGTPPFFRALLALMKAACEAIKTVQCQLLLDAMSPSMSGRGGGGGGRGDMEHGVGRGGGVGRRWDARVVSRGRGPCTQRAPRCAASHSHSDGHGRAIIAMKCSRPPTNRRSTRLALLRLVVIRGTKSQAFEFFTARFQMGNHPINYEGTLHNLVQ